MTQVFRQFCYSLWARTGGSQGGALIATGTLAEFAASTPPDGWLACDGSAVSRSIYATLFSVIGTAWGPGDGTNTFNLPDLRTRMSLGAGTGFAFASHGGNQATTIAQANLPNYALTVTDPGHTHAVTDPGHVHAITDPGHVHTALVAASTNTISTGAGSSAAGNTGSSVTGIAINSAVTGVTNQNDTTGVTVNSGGSGTPVETISPYAVVLKMIKT